MTPSILEIVLYVLIGLAVTLYVVNGIVKIKTGHGLFKKKKNKDNDDDDE